mgnify:CR=1 FL=1
MPAKCTHQKGIIHIPAIIFFTGITVFLIIFLTSIDKNILNSISTKNNQNVQGVLIAKEGEDSGSSGSSDESRDIETKSSPDKQRTEARFGEDEKIKTRIEPDRTRIDVYSTGVKVRYEIRNGRVIIKAETEEGTGVPEQELFKITDRLDKTGIKIATAGGALVVSRNQVGAVSNFPLQLDLNTNQLIASTSAGSRILTVLPDQAVQNMLAANVISRLGPPFIQQAVTSGQISSINEIVRLGLQNNVLVYQIQGIRDFNLLGFIPVSRPTTSIVSAETGQLLETQQSILTQIIDLLSP